jgi:2-polyprenyl-3-methyl-5-hydroxy-6-metoxy-1,4-benzoquinol methylase
MFRISCLGNKKVITGLVGRNQFGYFLFFFILGVKMEYWKLGNYRYLLPLSLLEAYIADLHGLTLDAGCGKGSLWWTNTVANTIGIDLDKKSIQTFTRAGGEGIIASITHLPFKAGVFRNVKCIHVLEHVGDKKAAIAELGRVTNGVLIGSTTNLLNPYMMLDVLLPKAALVKLTPVIGEAYERHSRLTTAQLVKLLAVAGFSTELICLSMPPFQAAWLDRFQSLKLPWYAHVWIVTNKLVSLIKVMKDTLVFKASK